jgi:hypothetical protein
MNNRNCQICGSKILNNGRSLCGSDEDYFRDGHRAAELFHKLWGKARGDSPQRPSNYDKKLCGELQSILNKLGVKV